MSVPEEIQVNRRKSLYGFEHTSPDRRRSEGTRKCDKDDKNFFEVKQLWQRSHEILRLTLLGLNEVQVAKILNISISTVKRTVNGNLGMLKLSSMRLERDKDTIDVAKEIERLYPLALKVYENLMEDEKTSGALKKEVADTVLMDIGGHRAPSKIQGQFFGAVLNRTEIEEVKRRGREAALASGHAIDVTPVPALKEGKEEKEEKE